MKVLESAPERYDRGIAMLTGNRIGRIYDRIAELAAAPGKRILDIGCGTGGVSLACAARGADVTGIDIDAEMLEVARAKRVPAAGKLFFIQLAAAELEDRFAEQSFDAVVSCLAVSEMSADEQDYMFHTAHALLVRDGVIVIADECEPEKPVQRFFYRMKRLPVAAVAYLLTQTTTRPVGGLGDRLKSTGFSNVVEERMLSGSFVIVHGKRMAP